MVVSCPQSALQTLGVPKALFIMFQSYWPFFHVDTCTNGMKPWGCPAYGTHCLESAARPSSALDPHCQSSSMCCGEVAQMVEE